MGLQGRGVLRYNAEARGNQIYWHLWLVPLVLQLVGNWEQNDVVLIP